MLHKASHIKVSIVRPPKFFFFLSVNNISATLTRSKIHKIAMNYSLTLIVKIRNIRKNTKKY